jgi:hypothetical protein
MSDYLYAFKGIQTAGCHHAIQQAAQATAGSASSTPGSSRQHSRQHRQHSRQQQAFPFNTYICTWQRAEDITKRVMGFALTTEHGLYLTEELTSKIM